MPADSSSRYNFARWLVMVISVANMLGAVVTFVLIWKMANTDMPRPDRIIDLVATSVALLWAGVTFLIAWHTGDQPANLAIALAFAFAGSNGIFMTLLEQLRANATIKHALEIPTFILGAGFFILASARFPRKLTPDDISSSRTIWGKTKPLRAVLIFFLRAPAVWIFVAIVEILSDLSDLPVLPSINWFAIVLLSLIYFYINYRAGDVETRKKVLWFFELCLLSFVVRLVWISVHFVLSGKSLETLDAVTSVILYSIYAVGQLFCVCMAVFYAGAISPTLVIRKTFVYGVTVALLLFAYATMEAFVANLLVDKIGVSNSFANALLGTVLALAFHPIKNRMEHGLKRFGSRATPPEPVTQ